ncbi:LPXTG cell wall anchor domain-containing protein [Clostridium baratii]
MKSIIKTLLLFLVIFSAITVRGEATEVLPSNVKLEGNSDGIVFISGDEPFLYKENMLPGDTVSRKMILKNNYTDSYFVYLKGERISKEEPYDLLDKIYVNITYENKSIYNGKILGENKESREIPLGLIKPGEEKQLTATATLDGDAIGNEYKNKEVEVNWIFTAVRIPNENDNSTNIYDKFKKYMKNILPKTGYENEYLFGVIIIASGIYLVIKRRK